MSENLRREARVDAHIQVLVVRGRRSVSLETSDVSFRGLFLRTDEPPPVRSLMRLRVMLPAREIEAHAMVVHVITPEDVDPTNPSRRGPGVGVQFWGLAGPDRAAWDDFVRELVHIQRLTARKPSRKPDDSESSGGEPSGVRIANTSPPEQVSSKK